MGDGPRRCYDLFHLTAGWLTCQVHFQCGCPTSCYLHPGFCFCTFLCSHSTLHTCQPCAGVGKMAALSTYAPLHIHSQIKHYKPYSLHLLNHIPVFSLSEQEKRMSTVLKIAFGLRYRKQSDGDHNGDRYAPAACLEADGDDDDGDYDYAPAASMEGDEDDDNYDYAPAA